MEVKEVEDYVQFLDTGKKDDLLGRKVNYQPLSNINAKQKSYPLNLLPAANGSKVQEALVVKDLLNVLIGLEGTYIRYNNNYDPIENGIPEFKIAKMMDTSLKSICNRIVKLGQLFIILTIAWEKWSNQEHGEVLQRLGEEIRKFLNGTYLNIIVNNLEYEYKRNPSFTIRDLEQQLNDTGVAKKMNIYYTIVENIMHETNIRAKMDPMQEDFNNFISDLKEQGHFVNGTVLVADTKIQPLPKGGVILKIIQNMVDQSFGDKDTVEFLNNILNSISVTYLRMLHKWLTQGILDDTYDEFMISDTMKQVENNTANLNYGDRIWDTQFLVRKDGLLPRFNFNENNTLLYEVLTTGKYLNVVKQCYGLSEIPNSDFEGVPHFVELMQGSNLELYIGSWYKRANSMCVKLFLEDYDLKQILRSMQKYFLGYHNGNFTDDFFKTNLVELTRTFKKDTSTQEMKLQRKFDLAKEIFKEQDLVLKLLHLQLDKNPFEKVMQQYIGNSQADVAMGDGLNETELLSAKNFQSLKDLLMQEDQIGHDDTDVNDSVSANTKTVIHHLQFDLNVPFPLNIILSKTCIIQYQLISRYVMLLQYHSRLLDNTWFEINKNAVWNYKGFSPVVKNSIIKKCRTLHNSMSQFVKAVLAYYTQNVIEIEMQSFFQTQFTNGNEMELTSWQLNLQETLITILTNCCSSQLLELQTQIMEIVYKFCKFANSMKRRLCHLDSILHATYLQNDPKAKQYNEQDALTIILPELLAYVTKVSRTFDQHKNAFAEGLTHYYHRTNTSTNISTKTSTANSLNSPSQSASHNTTETLIAALGFN